MQKFTFMLALTILTTLQAISQKLPTTLPFSGVTDLKLSDYKHRTNGYRGLAFDGQLDGSAGATGTGAGHSAASDGFGDLDFVKIYSQDKEERLTTMNGSARLQYYNDDSTATQAYGILTGNYST